MYHSRPNWTPLSPITIINYQVRGVHSKILKFAIFWQAIFVQGMSDLCVNPKGTVNYYVNSQPVLKNTGKIFSIFFFF